MAGFFYTRGLGGLADWQAIDNAGERSGSIPLLPLHKN